MTETTGAAGSDVVAPRPAGADGGSRDGGVGLRRPLNRRTRSAVEWVAVIVGALVVALVVKTFLFQAFYIPSESMVPTLDIGDRVLVNKVNPDDVSRGDVIVFARPGGPGADGIEDLIKRVVALEGEVVEGRNGNVVIDGQVLEEPYLADGIITSEFAPYTVPAGHVWVMGDNRGASDDSRRFKAVPLEDVVGRAFVVIWPLSQLGTL